MIVPPSHTDPWAYSGDPGGHRETLLSLNHAAVEAGLGTLGLNLQLLTPEYGPRVILTAVMCSVDVEADTPMENARAFTSSDSIFSGRNKRRRTYPIQYSRFDIRIGLIYESAAGEYRLEGMKSVSVVAALSGVDAR